MRKIFSAALLLASGMIFSLPSYATFIDFTAMADGNVTSIGDVTFSLAGTGEAGNPYVGGGFGGGIWNSSDGPTYPTNTILKAEFDTTASNIMFDFDNEGSKATFWSLFDAGDALIATGALSTGVFDLSAYSGVKSIEWNNNGNNWLFAVQSMSYDADADVPEPSVLALLALGLTGIGFARRRKA